MPVAESVLMTMFFMFIGAAILAAIFGIMFMLFLILTPANVFLKAKFKRKPLIAARRRDRKIDIHMADSYEQGLVISKEYGAFIVDPDAVYNEKKTGVPLLPVNAEIGLTLRESTLRMIDGLKQMGIDNIEEAEAYNAQYGICECSYEGLMRFEKDNEGNPVIVDGQLKLICPKEKKEVKDENTVQAEDKGKDLPGKPQSDKD